MSDFTEKEARALPEDIIAKAELIGHEYHVSGALHPLDFMFWFIYDDPARTNKLDAPILYAQSGREVVTFLRAYLTKRWQKLLWRSDLSPTRGCRCWNLRPVTAEQAGTLAMSFRMSIWSPATFMRRPLPSCPL